MEHHYLNLENLIIAGKNQEAKSIIRQYNLYRSLDPHNCTLLHYSSQHGNKVMTKYLLKNGSDVDAQGYMGWTPLMNALEKGDAKVIKYLLRAGADVLIKNTNNLSALHVFIKKEILLLRNFQLLRDTFLQRYTSSDVAAKRLIELGYRLNEVIYLKNSTIIEFMLQHGYDVANKQSTLYLAVRLCDLESVKVLLKYGADPNIRNASNNISISYLYPEKVKDDANQIEMLKVLLNAGVYLPETRISLVKNILSRGSPEAIRILINSGLNFNAIRYHGELTALHYLAMNKKDGIAEILKDHTHKLYVKVDIPGVSSPLQMAVCDANFQMVQFLIHEGANVNFVHSVGEYSCILQVYMKSGRKYQRDRCFEFLLQNNADIQYVAVKDNVHMTIFDDACMAKMYRKIGTLKPVVAQLAVREKLGTRITEITNFKIESQATLKKYLARCRKVLERKIGDTLTVFQLLTLDVKNMVKYFNNEKFVRELVRISYKKKLRARYSYYYNTLKKRCDKVFLYKNLKEESAKVICELSEYRLDESNIITEKIIGYLKEQDLWQLCKISG